LEDLAHDPHVAWAERNVVREPALDHLDGDHSSLATHDANPWPDEPLLRDTRQWGLANAGAAGVYGGIAGADVHALDAWSRSTGSASLRLAIADTGIDPNHPELQAALASGTRVELGVNVTGDPSPTFADSFGHGTAVVGVMAARTGEGAHFDSLGIAGVCGGDGGANPGCRIVPIKITPGHSGLASAFDIARAIVYAADVGARALNLSFAGGGPSRLEREALAYAIVRGCVVVAASGNRGASTTPRTPKYPAASEADGLCLQVGASDPWDRRAVFSSYGPGLDVVAPGVDVWSTFATYPSAAGASYRATSRVRARRARRRS
jgi:subtilisin family serine protease